MVAATVAAIDSNGNGRIEFADAVRLFNNLYLFLFFLSPVWW